MTLEQWANFFIKLGLITPKEGQLFLMTLILPKDFVQKIKKNETKIADTLILYSTKNKTKI